MLYVNETAELTGTGTSASTKINLTTVMISVTVVYVHGKVFEIFLKCGLPVLHVEYVLIHSVEQSPS